MADFFKCFFFSFHRPPKPKKVNLEIAEDPWTPTDIAAKVGLFEGLRTAQSCHVIKVVGPSPEPAGQTGVDAGLEESEQGAAAMGKKSRLRAAKVKGAGASRPVLSVTSSGHGAQSETSSNVVQSEDSSPSSEPKDKTGRTKDQLETEETSADTDKAQSGSVSETADVRVLTENEGSPRDKAEVAELPEKSPTDTIQKPLLVPESSAVTDSVLPLESRVQKDKGKVAVTEQSTGGENTPEQKTAGAGQPTEPSPTVAPPKVRPKPNRRKSRENPEPVSPTSGSILEKGAGARRGSSEQVQKSPVKTQATMKDPSDVKKRLQARSEQSTGTKSKLPKPTSPEPLSPTKKTIDQSTRKNKPSTKAPEKVDVPSLVRDSPTETQVGSQLLRPMHGSAQPVTEETVSSKRESPLSPSQLDSKLKKPNAKDPTKVNEPQSDSRTTTSEKPRKVLRDAGAESPPGDSVTASQVYSSPAPTPTQESTSKAAQDVGVSKAAAASSALTTLPAKNQDTNKHQQSNQNKMDNNTSTTQSNSPVQVTTEQSNTNTESVCDVHSGTVTQKGADVSPPQVLDIQSDHAKQQNVDVEQVSLEAPIHAAPANTTAVIPPGTVQEGSTDTASIGTVPEVTSSNLICPVSKPEIKPVSTNPASPDVSETKDGDQVNDEKPQKDIPQKPNKKLPAPTEITTSTEKNYPVENGLDTSKAVMTVTQETESSHVSLKHGSQVGEQGKQKEASDGKAIKPHKDRTSEPNAVIVQEDKEKGQKIEVQGEKTMDAVTTEKPIKNGEVPPSPSQENMFEKMESKGGVTGEEGQVTGSSLQPGKPSEENTETRWTLSIEPVKLAQETMRVVESKDVSKKEPGSLKQMEKLCQGSLPRLKSTQASTQVGSTSSVSEALKSSKLSSLPQVMKQTSGTSQLGPTNKPLTSRSLPTQKDSPSSWLDVDQSSVKKQKKPERNLDASVSEDDTLDTSDEFEEFIHNIKKLGAPFSIPLKKHVHIKSTSPPFAMPAIREDRFEKTFDPEEFQFGLRKKKALKDPSPGMMVKLQSAEARSKLQPKRSSTEDSLLFKQIQPSGLPERGEAGTETTEDSGTVSSRLGKSSILSSLMTNSRVSKKPGNEPDSATGSKALPLQLGAASGLTESHVSPGTGHQSVLSLSSPPPPPSFADVKLPDYLGKLLSQDKTEAGSSEGGPRQTDANASLSGIDRGDGKGCAPTDSIPPNALEPLAPTSLIPIQQASRSSLHAGHAEVSESLSCHFEGTAGATGLVTALWASVFLDVSG